ncbi:histidine phosphatase family protein [Luedemannella helvata]|uniref:Histidine phosphatase family protein n=1 Tax=Luedemannella helvata TaxID=349315 RepID=A0ABP4WTT1_9ACTN
MTRLLIWRHGQTAWNATDRVQGQTDVELDEVGVAQAERAAAWLAGFKPDLIFASDLSRAAGTAAALASLTGHEVEFDERLRERHFGPWQGLTGAEIAERYPDQYPHWRAMGDAADLPLESTADLGRRVTAALRDIAARVGDGTAVVATHGGAARQGVAGLLGWPAGVASSLGALGNCHVSDLRLTQHRGWQLRAHNVGPH